MTTLEWRQNRRTDPPAISTSTILATAATGSVLLVGSYLVANDQLLRIPLAAAFVMLIVGLAMVSPRGAIYMLVVWLGVLGIVRRLVSNVATPTSTDPLLLVAPLAFVMLLLIAASNGAFEKRTRLSTAVGALTVIALLSALNPLQGSLAAGFAGLLFVPVPLLAFWVGRSALMNDRTLSRLLTLIACFALAAAAYGLFQTFVAFPGWDLAWINQVKSDYTALNVQVAGTIRPFSTFSSAAEFGYFLGVAIVVWLVRAFRATRFALAFAAIAFLGTALIYESSRQVIFTLAVAVGLMLGAWRRIPFGSAVVVAAVLVVGVPFIAAHLTSGSGQAQQRLVAHQVQGLSNPLDPSHSTGRIHIALVVDGIKSAVHQPFGYGVGAINVAGNKFARASRNTEADPSNAGVAFGVPGLAAYLVILALALSGAYRLARLRRDWLAFAALGILGVTVSQWLTGGQYAVAFLPWLMMGWVDARLNEQPAVPIAERGD